jgi:hypothetical protein
VHSVESTVAAIDDLSIERWALSGYTCRLCGKPDGELLGLHYSGAYSLLGLRGIVVLHAACLVQCVMSGAWHYQVPPPEVQ